MKKKKLPKYVQDIFKKQQFKIGDTVKWEFLGESGWGIVKKILEANDKITYMVKTGKYTYPCGIQIKEYSSYYAGSIDLEISKDKKAIRNFRNATTKKRVDNRTREQIFGNGSNTVSNTRSGSISTNNIGISNGKNISTDTGSRKSNKNPELEQEIQKQQDFLRKFT
jgi:hypothetical protein